MYRIKTLNKISPAGLSVLDQTRFTISGDVENEDGILVRSADMHDYQFPDALRAVAVCALLLASRKITEGADWVRTQAGGGADVEKVVEKGKSQFVGPEISGKMLGVIGLGAIGVQVANIATKLGMTVFGYDPFLSVDGALALSRLVHRAMDLETIYKNCDYITLHVPQTAETRGMLNEDAFHMMKGGVRILNLARGGLVNDDDMLAALESGKVACYVTDFPNNKILQGKNVVAIPHLGASTPESEDNCAVMAVDQIKDYLENGNILNSVNLPSISMAREAGTKRICIIHKNVPNTIALFASTCGEAGINIENMQSKSKGEYAYTILDVSGDLSPAAVDALRALEPIVKVRVIQ